MQFAVLAAQVVVVEIAVAIVWKAVASCLAASSSAAWHVSAVAAHAAVSRRSRGHLWCLRRGQPCIPWLHPGADDDGSTGLCATSTSDGLPARSLSLVSYVKETDCQ